jgi:hypothetical protein
VWGAGRGCPLPAEKMFYFKYENDAFWCIFDGVVVKICLPISIGRVRFLCLGANSLPPLPSPPLPFLPSPFLVFPYMASASEPKKFLELQMLVSEF